MAACRPERRRHRVPFHRPRLQAHPERVGADCDPRVALQTGQSLPVGDADVERMQQRREEQEKLHPREDFAQAHPSSNAEGEEVLWFRHFAFGVDETGWVELFWFFPEIGVHVNRVEQGNYLRVLW